PERSWDMDDEQFWSPDGSTITLDEYLAFESQYKELTDDTTTIVNPAERATILLAYNGDDLPEEFTRVSAITYGLGYEEDAHPTDDYPRHSATLQAPGPYGYRGYTHLTAPSSNTTPIEVTPMTHSRSTSYGRSTRRYKKLRKDFREHSANTNAPCWLCKQPIDYRIEWPEDDAFELDHLYPVSTHPEHAEDPANFRASHRLCNLQRSNRMPTGGLGNPSRKWVK